MNVAALDAGPPQADVTKSVQAELRRVGCLSAEADGNWNTASQRSLTLFNRYAKTKLDTKLASTDALDTIKLKTARVCPLVCEHGYKADGERCTKITCAAGSFLNDDNECEKRRGKKPVAKRDTDDRRERARGSRAAAIPARGQRRQASRIGWRGDRASSFATRAVAGRLAAAVASTIRVAHLAMAAAAMWKSATECGGGNIPIGP